MKRTTMIVLLAVAMMSLASFAMASTATPRIDRREARQRARIHQGVKSGELRPGEAARLRAGQRHVHRMERRAKSDGVVTPAERARINHAQNRQSRKIYRLKHNDRVRS